MVSNLEVVVIPVFKTCGVPRNIRLQTTSDAFGCKISKHWGIRGPSLSNAGFRQFPPHNRTGSLGVSQHGPTPDAAVNPGSIPAGSKSSSGWEPNWWAVHPIDAWAEMRLACNWHGNFKTNQSKIDEHPKKDRYMVFLVMSNQGVHSKFTEWLRTTAFRVSLSLYTIIFYMNSMLPFLCRHISLYMRNCIHACSHSFSIHDKCRRFRKRKDSGRWFHLQCYLTVVTLGGTNSLPTRNGTWLNHSRKMHNNTVATN